MGSVSGLVAQLGDSDLMKAYSARMQLIDMVMNATKSATETASLAAAFSEVLSAKTGDGENAKKKDAPPKYPAGARRFVLQLLGQVAGDNEVPAIAAALKDLDVRDMARCALERIPGAKSTAALAAAADEVGPEFRSGVLGALAIRQTPEVQAVLHKQAAHRDERIRLAAVEALAHFPEASNDDVITGSVKSASARGKSRAQRARIRLAESLVRAGKKAEGVAIYKSILGGDNGEPQKKAARIALDQLT